MRWSLFALSLASCFNPTYPEIGCGPDGWCPEGQSCGGDGLCHHAPDAAPLPDGAALPDGTTDGRVGPDATPTIDGATDTTPPTATHAPTDAVLEDDVAVVITFSESMATSSLVLGGTLGAYAHSETWTSTTFPDDTLTVAPAVATPFWPASDPQRTLIVDADDLAGNPLATYTIAYDAPPLESFLGGGSGAALGGVEGFDVNCQNMAESEGLPGTWVAWISSSTSDAYCRLHGLTGTRLSYCGQVVFPASAGPWVRRDGVPFLELVGGLPHQLGPPIVAAGGGYFGYSDGGERIWSSTDVNGAFVGVDCAGWTNNSAPGTTTTGESTLVRHWTDGSTGACTDVNRQVCLEVGRGGPLPPQPAGKRAFVTAAAGSGNLSTWAAAGGNSGVAAGDAICRSQATAAGLPNATAFKAWLSTSTVGAEDRLTSDGPWVRHDGVLVASTKASLTLGGPTTSVLYDQNGVPANVDVFTGTTWSGAAAADTCANWTSSTASALGGTSDRSSNWWTEEWNAACTLTAHLYCFED